MLVVVVVPVRVPVASSSSPAPSPENCSLASARGVPSNMSSSPNWTVARGTTSGGASRSGDRRTVPGTYEPGAAGRAEAATEVVVILAAEAEGAEKVCIRDAELSP